ncbi:MAG: 1-propanol dehydrogenase PduQ [Eubacteriales bacterium]|jgi:1-propanol dehydrogenase
MKRFKLKTDIIFGNDALGVLKTIASDSAVLFTDAFMVSSGTADALKAYMTACKNITVFSDVKPDPPVELISQAVKFVMDVNADTVFALGGGSAIDAAKSTLMIIREHYGKNIKLIAIPTTSGTGSEVTQFSVITDTAAGKKLPLVDESMLPEIAVLDAELVKSVPPAITADTGFDVLTHALEAYISTEANDFSDALAEKAVELVADNLVPVYKNGADLDARAKMHTASCLAGIAFNEVSLGINHGIAHALGAQFHIPHGRANAMLLPHVLYFNAELDIKFCVKNDCKTADKLEMLARRLGYPANSPDIGVRNMIQRIKEFQRILKIPTTLGDAGVTKSQYEKVKDFIIESALNDACTATNPRKASPKDVEGILEKIAKF